MLASRMTPELEDIDYSSPVLLKKVLTTASRDSNGEMNEKDPAVFEGYPNGGLSPGGVATLLKGIKNSKFDPSELENSDGRVRLLNGNKQNNTECNLWAIEADMYLSLIHISEPTRLRRISYAGF